MAGRSLYRLVARVALAYLVVTLIFSMLRKMAPQEVYGYSPYEVRVNLSWDTLKRLITYLQLEKPDGLDYVTWLVGDDWLGADWMYLGWRPYQGGEVFIKHPVSGDSVAVTRQVRFWVDPGPAMFRFLDGALYVWGERTGESTCEPYLAMQPEATWLCPVYHADRVEWTHHLESGPGIGAPTVAGFVHEVTGRKILLHNSDNWDGIIILTDEQTDFVFQRGFAAPRPDEGWWLNITALTGTDGLLGQYNGLHREFRGVLRWDFGQSWLLAEDLPVTGLAAAYLPQSLLLIGVTLCLVAGIAMPLGMTAGLKPVRWPGKALNGLARAGAALPAFWLGLMLIFILSDGARMAGMPYLPRDGRSMIYTAQSGSLVGVLGLESGSLPRLAIYTILPTLALGLTYMAAGYSAGLETMQSVMQKGYIRNARGYGYSANWVLWRHALPNAVPVLAQKVLRLLPGMLGGLLVVEVVTGYPGVGRLYWDALVASDWPVVIYLLFLALVVTGAADWLAGLIRPGGHPKSIFWDSPTSI